MSSAPGNGENMAISPAAGQNEKKIDPRATQETLNEAGRLVDVYVKVFGQDILDHKKVRDYIARTVMAMPPDQKTELESIVGRIEKKLLSMGSETSVPKAEGEVIPSLDLAQANPVVPVEAAPQVSTEAGAAELVPPAIQVPAASLETKSVTPDLSNLTPKQKEFVSLGDSAQSPALRQFFHELAGLASPDAGEVTQ